MKQLLLKEIEQGTKSALIKKKIITYCIYNGSSTITEIAKELNLSIPTVTKFINEMCEDGYLNDNGKLETNGGRYPNLYDLNPTSCYFIGVDVRMYGIDLGLMNFKGEMLKVSRSVPYKFENSQEGLEVFCELVRHFIEGLDVDHKKILQISVNISGRVNPESGYSYSMFNFSEEPLSEVLTSKIGYSTHVENDTRAMTYGEYLRGNVNGEKHVIFVNISWGLGIGIIIDGSLYTGRSGFSGEFGHVCAFDNEVLCHCGKKGCIETEASGRAFYRKLQERLANGERSILSDRLANNQDPLSMEEIIEAVNKEDLVCIEILEDMGQALGRQIAGLINIFNPELVVIGGSLSQTEEYLIQPIKTAVRKYSLNLARRDTRIIVSRLKEKAGVVGACLLARSRMFELAG